MELKVEHKDTIGKITNKIFRLTRVAFAKHFAIAGQGYAPRPQKIFRAIGMFFHYSYYLQRKAFYSNRFSSPPKQLSDPTEKGQFSNLAGKAIADFLSKRIDNSIYTVNYEAAMRIKGMPINIRRPDLLAYTQNSVFALEAKGYTGGSGNMVNHKGQSKKGGIPVNFSVACVSHNLYKRIQCKYHDPFNDNIQYDIKALRELTKIYYSGLAEFLNEKYFECRQTKIDGEKFYTVELPSRNFKMFLPEELPLRPFWFYKIFDFYRPRLILPGKILEYAKNGITNKLKPFQFEIPQEKNIYIDNDRVGLQIER